MLVYDYFLTFPAARHKTLDSNSLWLSCYYLENRQPAWISITRLAAFTISSLIAENRTWVSLTKSLQTLTGIRKGRKTC